ncbi:unnamed protein product [Cyprideis torosa]|uniref:Tubulin-specific chaperone D n=1 Tax=Cyprideis torosa TaxID=163714 RepID=A0A7R8WBZ6_9CRUS|nr:unnamed protein product [Cyprideis torosa]CAG0892864.1 unnamed protein product [Cyprideis torosa]
MIRQTNLPPTLLHQCFKYLYFITKVRGYKTVVRFLPHEVSDLEPVLRMLQTMDRSDSKIWESHYMLLLWLSIIILLPFPMTRLEGISGGVGSGKQSTQERVLSEIKASLIHPVFDFRCSIAAAYLASVFLGRPDTKEACLEGFITWAIDGLRDAAVAQGSKLSLLTALAQLFKHGKRDDLLPYSKVVLETLLKQIDESFGALREKIQLKLLQRVGLTFLQPRVAAWRYQRGSRSLEDNLKTSSSVVNGSASNVFVSQAQASPVQGEDYDIPEEVELIIERLLEGLRNSENIVRWSAAKGIGRITGRLPVELAEDVISSLLDLFSLNELDSAWHGSCLALAELGRRGLLLPKNLSAIIRVLQTALFYDVPQGSFSVGSHVRDAACYLAWSFARAYDPVVLAPFVPELARSLLVMTCFDREINCRRAASAAFQENVGRQGETFAHGIDIVTAADFFAVSNRNNAFLEISRFIAQYPEYRRSLIDHLVERKVNHWDLNIREVTSQALRALTPFDAEYMATTVLAKLMGLASSSSDINAKHGSLIALAEVCKAITEQDPALLSRQPGSVEFLTTFVPRLRSSLVFRQLGADMMRGGTCLFIQRLAESNVGLESIESWLEHIWECLVYIDNNVQLAACCALAQVTSKAPQKVQQRIIDTCIREINCRRAASAAFQENVGRQGETFAHGIDIVTAADFFAVSNRSNAFLEISRFIAQYPEYRRSLIDHLVERKVNHWDLNIREVTSQALRALTPFDAEYMATTVLAKLMGLASSSSDINAKHGSLIALAEVCKAITEQDPALLSRQPGSVEFLTTFVPRLRSSLVFRQLGADMMRGGTCLFIQRLAESNVGLESIESWLEHIWECLVYIDNNVQLAACCALAQVTSKAPQKVQQRIIDTCIQNLNGNEKQARLGFSQAVTKLPMEFQKTSCFLDPLIFASSIHAGEDAWADVRREGVRALGSLVVASAVSMNQQDIDRVFDVLFTAAQDYTTEKRGDVGAWVREAAMESMIKVVEALEAVGRDSEVISTEVVLQMAGVMAQLSCERIEKTRTLAANSFVKLLYCKVGSRLPNQDQLKSKFHEGMDKEWGMGASTSIYGYFADLLVHPNFQKWVLRGLVQAIGGVTEHLVRRSSDALFTVCKREQNEDLSATFVKHLLDIWEENQRNDRVVIPMLNTLDKILNSSQFAFLSTHPEETEAESPGKRIIELVKQEMSRCNNVAKILSGVNLLCDLLGFADLKVCRRALQHVTLFLCFRYPRVRRASAVRLYESLLVAGDSLAFIPNLDALDQALAILSDTQWGGDMDAVKRARDELCACLDVPTPVLIQKPSTT